MAPHHADHPPGESTMRHFRSAAYAIVFCLPGLAAAASLPNTTAGESGKTAGFASLLCGIPGSRVDAFRTALDRFVPGTSTSPDFARGERSARQLIATTQANNNGDVTELRQSTCTEVSDTVDRVLATSPR
jgi:hypothetical protein